VRASINFALVLLAAVTSASVAADAPPCAVRAQTPQGEPTEIHCVIAADQPLRLRFVADFIGSHDDTELSIAPTLNGAPLTCAAGSKTQSTAEEGEVRLECAFVVAAAKEPRALLIALRIFHAQYAAHRLTVE
jgi:hypothetical protein